MQPPAERDEDASTLPDSRSTSWPIPDARAGAVFSPSCSCCRLLANLLLLAYLFWPTTESDEPQIIETQLYGKKTESNKIAVVRAEGALAEGLDSHILRQIESGWP